MMAAKRKVNIVPNETKKISLAGIPDVQTTVKAPREVKAMFESILDIQVSEDMDTGFKLMLRYGHWKTIKTGTCSQDKFDLREWATETEFKKGITLTKAKLQALKDTLNDCEF